MLRQTCMAESVPLELLHSMEVVLQKYRDELSSWNHDLTERSKILDGQLGRLDGFGKIWKATLQLPELSSAAPEIPQRVGNIIELIERSQRAAESLRQRDLILQGHVLEAATRLQTIAPAFEQAQIKAANNLFVQDSPPIWSLGIEHWKEVTRTSFIPPASVALLETSTLLFGNRLVLASVAANQPGITTEPAPQAYRC